MQKSLIITAGVLLILVVMGVWAYLLFYGTPSNSNDVFANLGFTAPTALPNPVSVPAETQQRVTEVGTQGKALRQLTTRPIAGFMFVGSSSDHIRYVERGTGHVFDINTVGGSERRVSGTTIPRVVEAVFSNSGSSVAFVSETDYVRDIVIGSINETEGAVDLIPLPSRSFDVVFESNSLLRYAVTTEAGTDIYQMDIDANESEKLHTTVLGDIKTIFNDGTYIYNRPAARFKGSLYKIGPTLTPVTPSEYGLVGGVTDTHYIVSSVVDDELQSYALERIANEKILLAVPYVPEKCAPGSKNDSVLWCASPLPALSGDFLERWYRGETISEDLLWHITLETGEALLVSNFLEESGRLIDVDSIRVDRFGDTVLLRNRIDNTLWLYDSDQN